MSNPATALFQALGEADRTWRLYMAGELGDMGYESESDELAFGHSRGGPWWRAQVPSEAL